MKILFISSGNSGKISPIVQSQGESLKKFNLSVDYYLIQGKGFKGYLKNISKLKNHLKNNTYDVIHAHYSLTAFVATLAGAKPLVVSLMGSDTSNKSFMRWLIKIFAKCAWKETIVKSDAMSQNLKLSKVHVLPNGVNFDHFKSIPREIAVNKLGWDASKKYVLFAANPNRAEKNFQLANEAFNQLHINNLEIKTLENVAFDHMPFYYNAADVVLLTSHREGSPNVVKEAMACARPIVVTNVGDVVKVLNHTENTFVVQPQADEVAQALQTILNQQYTTTKGRETIAWLNQNEIASKLIDLYKSIKQ